MKYSDKKIVFMGTPSISAKVLKGIILEGYNVVAVVAQPDRPVGRKKILEPVPTKQVAQEFNIPVYQPIKIRNDYDFINAIKPDLIITLAYGQIVPQGLLDIPVHGCLNLHGSLLPKYRGAAPIQYALMNNDKETGMTLMKMIKEMDAGEMYDVEKVAIDENDNSTSLFEKMGDAALKLIIKNLPQALEGKLKGVNQDENLVTFCPSIKPEEEKLDLKKSKESVYGYIRALSDQPGAYLFLDGQKVKLFASKIVSDETHYKVGEIIQADKNGLFVQASNGVLSILSLQKEGKTRMDFKSFVNGNPNLVGKIFE